MAAPFHEAHQPSAGAFARSTSPSRRRSAMVLAAALASSLVRVRASSAAGALTTPESGELPVGADGALGRPDARVVRAQRDQLRPVFVDDAGGYLDGSTLPWRSKLALHRAGLRPLRF